MADFNTLPAELQQAAAKDPALMQALMNAPVIGATPSIFGNLPSTEGVDIERKKITLTITADSPIFDDFMTALAFFVLSTRENGNPEQLALELTCPPKLDFIVETDEESTALLNDHIESLAKDFANYDEAVNTPIVTNDTPASDDAPVIETVVSGDALDAVNLDVPAGEDPTDELVADLPDEVK